MRGAFGKLASLAIFGALLPAIGFAQTMPPACHAILSHMDTSVQNGGPTMHRYCGRFANGGEYVVVAYSNQDGKYTAYTATQSGQNVEAVPASFNNGTLYWHSVIAGVTRTVVITYRLASNGVLTRIARGTEGATITLTTDRMSRI